MIEHAVGICQRNGLHRCGKTRTHLVSEVFCESGEEVSPDLAREEPWLGWQSLHLGPHSLLQTLVCL